MEEDKEPRKTKRRVVVVAADEQNDEKEDKENKLEEDQEVDRLLHLLDAIEEPCQKKRRVMHEKDRDEEQDKEEDDEEEEHDTEQSEEDDDDKHAVFHFNHLDEDLKNVLDDKVNAVRIRDDPSLNLTHRATRALCKASLSRTQLPTPLLLRIYEATRYLYFQRDQDDDSTLAELAFDLLGSRSDAKMVEVHNCFLERFVHLTALRELMSERGLLIDEKKAEMESMQVALHHAFYTALFAQSIRMPEWIDESQCKLNPYCFVPVPTSIADDRHKLYLHCLESFKSKGYQRKGDAVYEEALTTNGIPTHAWRRRGTMREFVESVCPKEIHLDMHARLHTGLTKKFLIQFLVSAMEFEIQDLNMDRTITSWQDGIYFARIDLFVPYTHPDYTLIPSSVAACKYFDSIPFCKGNYHSNNFLEIHHSLIDILRYQEFTDIEIKWVLGMAGRMIYTPKELDHFEVMLFLIGLAGCGKSRFLQAIQQIFDKDDVGTLSSTMEPIFGLSSIHDKLMFVAPDLKAQCTWRAEHFQTMTSFEHTYVAVKRETAGQREWKVPGICAGNELPADLVDISGSVFRRLFLVVFSKRVKNKNTNLGEEIRTKQMAAIYRSINLAYQWVLNETQGKDFWSCVPEKFVKARQLARHNNNPLMMFVDNSDWCKYGAGNYCTYEMFLKMFKQFKKSRNWDRQVKFERPIVEAALAEKGCQIITCEKPWPKKSVQMHKCEWVIGLEVEEPDPPSNPGHFLEDGAYVPREVSSSEEHADSDDEQCE